MPKLSEDSYLNSSRTVIADVVERQRHEIRRLATEEIRKLEDRRDSDLRTLDDVLGALEGRGSKDVVPRASSAPALTPSRGSSRRRRRRRGNPAQVALENREAILRHLEEGDRQMAAGEIRNALGISEHAKCQRVEEVGQRRQGRPSGIGLRNALRACGEKASAGLGCG